MVSMVHTNNVTGTTIPVKDIIHAAHDRKALVMLDGAQSAPHRSIDVERMDVDLFAFSAHKMLGPSGVGILYAKKDILSRIEPLIGGGGGVGMTTYTDVEFLPPPERFESGLQKYSGMIGTGAAIDYLQNLGMDNIAEHEERLNIIATKELMNNGASDILRPLDAKLRSGILSFNVKGMTSHDVAMIIDEMAKIEVRSGMHCVHPFFGSRNIPGAVRASFYLYNTEDEVKQFSKTMNELVSTVLELINRIGHVREYLVRHLPILSKRAIYSCNFTSATVE